MYKEFYENFVQGDSGFSNLPQLILVCEDDKHTAESFKEVVKKLNSVKGVPKKIKNKFNELNTIGIGRKARMLLAKYKINYDEYSEVFSVRGKVVHGSEVDIKEMYMASQKAKELLTILTLKKLSYNGYIRNFTNDDELILIKDLSRHRVIENNNDIDFLI